MHRPNCPACSCPSSSTLVSESYTSDNLLAYMHGCYSKTHEEIAAWLRDAVFEVRECKACGLCWQTFYPDADLASELYDRWINADNGAAADIRRPSIDGYVPLLQEVVALGKYIERASTVPACDIKVLDFGMGWGSWLRLARAMGMNAYGYEVSQARREHARSLGIPCLDDAELREHRFHIINLEQVLEHVPDPRATIQQLLPLLTDDGILKIGVPNGRNTAALLRAHGTSRLMDDAFTTIAPLQHVNAFTPVALRRMAAQLGLRVRKEPVRSQFALIAATSVKTLARSVGRPLVRGVLGVGTSVVLSR